MILMDWSTMGAGRSASAAALAPVTAAGGVAGRTALMDEQGFRVFYDRTARPLRAYLIGACGDPTLADDLLQESYFRLVRSDFEPNDEQHRKNYLFRIATNLLRDHFRRRRPETSELGEIPESNGDHGDQIAARTTLMGSLRELKPRERQLLWLAYVEGMSHREIARALGLKTDSIRPLLFRARKRMAGVLRSKGVAP
jgi:RNA polymerase sigma-70 factor (ECF subfamily)